MAFRNAAIAIGQTGNSLAQLYECPPGYEAVIHSLYIANNDTTDHTITVTVNAKRFRNTAQNNPSTTNAVVAIASNIDIPAGNSLILDKPINLRPTTGSISGDTVSVSTTANSSAGNVITVFASILLTAADEIAPA